MSPHLVAGVDHVTKMTSADRLTCALSSDGKVRCFGELVVSDTESAGDHIVTLPIPPAIDIAVGPYFACGLDRDGITAHCVGDAKDFTGSEPKPTAAVKLPEKAKRLVSGGAGLCAETEAGKLWCGGRLAALLTRSGAVKPGAWEAYDATAHGFAAFQSDVCGVTTEGTAVCAGSLDHIVNALPRERRAGEPVVGLSDAIDITAADTHACAKKRDGSVVCWGGGYDDSAVPRPIPLLANLGALASGATRTCGTTSSGTFRCWSPSGDTGRASSDLGEPSVASVRSIGIGAGFGCVVDEKGGLRCFGRDDVGALGYPVAEDSGRKVDEPKPIAGIAKAVEVAAGGNVGCAVLESGAVRCWGANADGQLGQGTIGPSGTAADVVGLASVKDVAVTSNLACALTKDGHASCWGGSALTPVPWAGSDVVSIAAGGGNVGHSCIARSNGKVECGLPGSARTIRNVDRAKKVVTGEAFGCALLDDGTVRCWGTRNEGQLGDGRPRSNT